MNEETFNIGQHTADLIITLQGDSLPRLFNAAASGMFAAKIGIDIQDEYNGFVLSQEKKENINISVDGYDWESLLVNFLNELIYLSDINHEIYTNFDFKKLEPNKLESSAQKIFVSDFALVIKGATYHELKIQKLNDHYKTTIIFDI